LPAGQESLRQAIEDVNSDPNPALDTIDFSIPGSGVQTIQPVTDLPTITHSVLIDGYSQPGSSPNTLAIGDNAVLTIELDCTGVDTGLFIAADQSTVQGLVVNRSNYYGIRATGAHDVIQGCFIGTDPSGTIALGNQWYGIVMSGAGSRLGTNGDGINDYAERNLISGNQNTGADVAGTSILVAGNYFGTDASGGRALVNAGASGLSTAITISGAPPAPGVPPTRLGVDGQSPDPAAMRNLISGNPAYGAYVGSNVVVAGNYIGTDATGTLPLGNGLLGGNNSYAGLYIGGDNNLVGSDGDGVGDQWERNIVSGNYYGAGIVVTGSYNQIAGNYIGTDPTGTFSVGRQGVGVTFWGGSLHNVLGYDPQHPVVDPAAQRNVISGNFSSGVNIMGDQNVVAGNFIGTDASGTMAIANSDGISISGGSYNEIGTNSDGVGDDLERNIISGNGAGVVFDLGESDYNVVAGNYIGLDVTGTRALANDASTQYYPAQGVAFARGTGVGNTIGGTTAGAGNVISSAGQGYGIRIDPYEPGDSWSQTVIAGNHIGTDATGRHTTDPDGVPLGCSRGMWIAEPGTTGTLIEGNVVGACGEGIRLDGGSIGRGPTGSVIVGNWIGADSYGDNLADGTAIILTDGTTNTQVGGPGPLSNTIAFNAGDGIDVDPTGPGNSIRGNSIHDNALGISVDPTVWPFPVLSAAYTGASTVVIGTLNSRPNSTFTIDFYSNPAPDRSGYFEGETYLRATTVTTDSTGYASINATGLAPAGLGQWITATATLTTYDTSGNPNYLNTSEFSRQGEQVTQALTTTTLTASADTSSFGRALTFTAGVTGNSGSGTPTGRVDFVDTTTGIDLGIAALSGGIAKLSTSSLPLGSQTITASYLGDGTYPPSSATTTVSIGPSIIVTNPTAGGALTVSGNASIDLPGMVAVDSNAASALSAAGNAQITASAIDVLGGFQKTGNATFNPAPATGVSVADPLAGLLGPGTSGLTCYGELHHGVSQHQSGHLFGDQSFG
jgi:titin